MPFAVFRQHQRKLLAVFAILAMVGFVLSDTLPRWMNSGGTSDRDLEVAQLHGKKVHLSDLAMMRERRQRANRFMALARRDPEFFGGVNRPDLIDAMILEREADRLGIPSTPEFARKWIDRETFGTMNAQSFEYILGQFDNQVGGEQMLTEIAGQVRILLAREVVATPVVTPLDVFRNFRDQSERASFKAVPFLVEAFTAQVADPGEAEVRELYEKYKDVLPDPSRPSPGFKIPRQIKVESLTIDANAVAERIRPQIAEEELKSYYEGRKGEFPMDNELPVDVFLGEPKLTPPRYLPFADQRDMLARALAREKANEEIQNTFAMIRDEVIDKATDKYQDMVDEIAEARKEGRSTEGFTLPIPENLGGVARKYHLVHDVSPMLDRREAERYGQLASARFGSAQSTDSRNFAAIAFDPKTALYEGFELNDLGLRHLARKIADVPPHVAELSEVRSQVVRAWKREKARPLARKAAEDYAAKVKAEGGEIKGLTVGTSPVISIPPTTKYQPGISIPSQFPGQARFERGPASLTALTEIPEAGPDLIDTLFALKPGEVAVKPDLPEATYYTMALDHRDPVSYTALMGPGGSLISYWRETQMEIMRKSYADGMTRLRAQAGYKPENYPTEEQLREGNRAG
jgi:hypothetical protein